MNRLYVAGSDRSEAISSPPREGAVFELPVCEPVDPGRVPLLRNSAAPMATTIAATARDFDSFPATDDLTGQLVGRIEKP
jgi:hypothetical protein